MIDIKWGKFIEYPTGGEKRRKYLFRFYGHGIVFRNFLTKKKIFFFKWDKDNFAICKFIKLREGEAIKYIFGWNVRPEINFMCDCYDPYKLSIHFCNKEFLFKR